MGKQSLARSEKTDPQEVEQMALLDLAEPVRYGKQSNVDSIIIMIRWLSIFFCLAFWFGVYTLAV
jgi:hypothetical protein